MKLKPNEIIEVTWTDAFGTSAWESRDDLPPPPTIKSIGYFLESKNKGIYLTSGLSCPGLASDILGFGFIPQGMIKKIRRLR